MKIMHCPLNGPRNISEFVYGGEVLAMPNPTQCSDREWADYVFYKDNAAAVITEWWLHAPSSYWFIAERHTVSDDILQTYDPATIFKERQDFSHSEAAASSTAISSTTTSSATTSSATTSSATTSSATTSSATTSSQTNEAK